MSAPAKSSTVILGRRAVLVTGDAPREPDGATFADLESLLAQVPRSVVVADSGAACFFRASLAMERGARRVLVRHDALEPALVGELAARARELGAELALRGPGNEQAVAHPGARLEVGAPARSALDATPRAAVAETIDAARSAASADHLVDDDAAGPGIRAEQIAFEIGLKPVLYLVLTPSELAAARARHPDAHVETEADRVSIDAASGARAYGDGVPVVHAFLAADRSDARRAADAWRQGSSRNVRELGALMGYPPCCTAAFAALASRRDNAALVHVTAARTTALAARFAPPLNVAVHRWVPFTPCVFSCPAAVRWSERVLSTLEPTARGAADRALGRAVYYVDEAHAVVFDDARIRTRGATRELEYARARWLPRPGAEPALRRSMCAHFGAASHVELDATDLAPAAVRGLSAGRPGVLLPFGIR